MKRAAIIIAVLGFIIGGPLSVAYAHDAANADASGGSINQAFSYAIPNVPGKVVATLVVNYPPGARTPEHVHGKAFVIGYVLEGAIKSRIDEGETHVYHAGDSWTEKPGALHRLSENASNTEPAKLLAIFIANKDQKDLVHLVNKPLMNE